LIRSYESALAPEKIVKHHHTSSCGKEHDTLKGYIMLSSPAPTSLRVSTSRRSQPYQHLDYLFRGEVRSQTSSPSLLLPHSGNPDRRSLPLLGICLPKGSKQYQQRWEGDWSAILDLGAFHLAAYGQNSMVASPRTAKSPCNQS
jgi:hypothetical protein